jgi:signal transduction histidine kinase
VDRVRFAQVIGNLVRNALKFTEMGSVKIGCRRLSNHNFYFYVADTGCGIDEVGRHAIFERFVKMNYNIKGTGLGLSITKSIVEVSVWSLRKGKAPPSISRCLPVLNTKSTVNFDLPVQEGSISHFLQLLEVADYFQIIAVGAGIEFIP